MGGQTLEMDPDGAVRISTLLQWRPRQKAIRAPVLVFPGLPAPEGKDHSYSPSDERVT